MDPVTTAIVAALAAGVTSGLAQTAVADAYTALKEQLTSKCGSSSPTAKAVADLETRPESKGKAQVLAEELEVAGAPADAELVRLAEVLLEQLKATPGGEQHIQQAIGSGIAIADRGGNATVNITRDKE